VDIGHPTFGGSATLPLRGARNPGLGLGRARCARPARVAGTARPGCELELLQYPAPEVGRRRHGGNGCQEGQGAGELAAGGAAGLAVVDVAGDPLADEGGEPAVPVGQQAGQVGAVGSAQAGDEEGAEGAFDLVAEAGQEDVGVGGLDADGLAQVGALEAVAEVEVEQGAVAFGQAGGGVPDQLAEVGALGGLLGAGRGVGRSVMSSSGARRDRALARRRAWLRATAYSQGRRRSGSRSWPRRSAATRNASWVASAASSRSRSTDQQKSCRRSA
jgi:hypothetical protein